MEDEPEWRVFTPNMPLTNDLLDNNPNNINDNSPMVLEKQKSIIDQTQLFDMQVAGHTGTIRKLDSFILKPLVPQELEFYEKSQSLPIKQIIPKYHGLIENYLKLENLIHGLNESSVMDVKVGKKLYGWDATIEKRARMEEQSMITTSGQLGLRICGMKKWNGISHESFDKSFGRNLTVDTIQDGFKLFFQTNQQLQNCILELKTMIRILKMVNCWFGGSSILLMIPKHNEDLVMVKMVDFAHSHYCNEHEDDVESSLERLIGILDGIKY